MELADQRDTLQMALQRELDPGERIRWQSAALGQIEWSGFAIWLFAIPWTAFALLWTGLAWAGVSNEGAAGVGMIRYAFPLFGVPFVLVGLGMLAAPFLSARSARQSLFAVTSQRLLRIRSGRKLEVESIPADRIGPLKRNERRDGSGTLACVVRIGRDSDGDRSEETFTIGPVADIARIEQEVRRLAQEFARPVSS